MNDQAPSDARFEAARPKLFGLAYRMLGTVTDAEDAVQDAYLRWQQVETPEAIRNPEAFLVTVTTRLCIDQLKSARVQREQYIGPWLPEPIVEDPLSEPGEHYQLAESLSFAFMVMLEKLNPVERAAYLLREAFEFSHGEIAEILDRSAADSRQLNKRARTRIGAPEQRFESSEQEQQNLLLRFMGAATEGNFEPLFDLLAEDIALYSDGGGKVMAALKVLRGKERIIAFLERISSQIDANSAFRMCRANGQPAVLQSVDDKVTGLYAVRARTGKLQEVYVLRNPDKLASVSLASLAAR